MTLTDDLLAKSEAQGTSRSQVVTAGALGLLMLALHGHPNAEHQVGSFQISYANAPDTHKTISVRSDVSDLELFSQLNRIYDYLLAERVELEDDARRILYSNLWELYE